MVELGLFEGLEGRQKEPVKQVTNQMTRNTSTNNGTMSVEVALSSWHTLVGSQLNSLWLSLVIEKGSFALGITGGKEIA